MIAGFLAGLVFMRGVEDVKVTFDLKSPGLPSDTAVFVTGSLEQLGSWNPGKIRMDKVGNHEWRKEIRCASGLNVEYKYTLGSWDREGAHANGTPLSNLGVQVRGDTVTQDVIQFWTKPARKTADPHKNLKGFDYYRGMRGAGLRNRDVIVWVPPEYRSHSNRRYPVLYMHDGQNVFDPATSFAGRTWQADSAAMGLISAKQIAPAILVGIYNTADRTVEYSPGKKGDAYMRFIVNVLKPFIDKTYRTQSDRESTFTAGSSMGGLVSFMLVWEHSDVFSGAICMSPAFLDPDKSAAWNYVSEFARSTQAKPKVFFYIDDGGVGLDQVLQPGIDKMIAAMKAKGFQEHRDFVFVKAPAARHSESDWAKRLPAAMKLVIKG
jgi:predicted alpha/beta superfamily hydrolase